MTTLTAMPPRPASRREMFPDTTVPGVASVCREALGIVVEACSSESTRHPFLKRHLMINDPKPSVYTRQSLLERLKDWDDSSSWKEFFETYWKLIFSVARRAGLSEAEAEDVVQETIIAVARKMPEFQYDRAVGSFKGYLMHLTRARIADHFRRKSYRVQGERRPREVHVESEFIEAQAATGGIDLEALWEMEWKAQLLEAAMNRVRTDAKARQFQIFQLHVCKGIPAREVADRLKVKLPEVYFAKYKISAAIKREMRRLEKSMI